MIMISYRLNDQFILVYYSIFKVNFPQEKNQRRNEGNGSFMDVDKSRVAGNLRGCESTFTRLINWGIN